jgi:hypothetical protein
MNKEREYLKDKINELAKNSKKVRYLYRGKMTSRKVINLEVTL